MNASMGAGPMSNMNMMGAGAVGGMGGGGGMSGGAGMGGGFGGMSGGGSMMRRQQEDEYLLMRNQMNMQNAAGISGPGMYGGSAAMGLAAQQMGYPGGGMPYEAMMAREEAVMGMPYVLDPRQQEAMMMRGFPYDQQQPGMGMGMGMGMPFQGGGFDASGAQFGQQPDSLPQQPAMRPGGAEAEDVPLDLKVKQEDDFQDKLGNKESISGNPGDAEMESKPDAQQASQKAAKSVRRPLARPLSAYNLFFSDERERIIKEREAQGQVGVKIQVQEMAKIIGERWKQIPDDMRKHYQDLADEDYKKYRKAKRTNPKDPTQPKRPPTAFLLFSNKRRKQLKTQYPGASNSDLSKMLSKTWQEAPSAIRNKYMNEASELSKQYKAKMALWRKNMGNNKREEDEDGDLGSPAHVQKTDGDDAPQPLSIDAGGQPFGWEDGAEDGAAASTEDPMRPVLPVLPSKPPVGESPKKRKGKDPSMPKRPLSAFLAFSNSRRKDLKMHNPEATNADLSKMLSKQWRDLSRDERQTYIDEAAEKSEVYKVEMAEWKLNGGTDPNDDDSQ